MILENILTQESNNMFFLPTDRPCFFGCFARRPKNNSSLHNIPRWFINRIVVVNNSISKVYLFIRMETLNFHKVCNSRKAVPSVCGIYYFLFDIF